MYAVGMVRSFWPSLAIVVSCLLHALPGFTAECDCDHSIAPNVSTLNGADLGVQPGDVICIEAGKREFLVLENIVGSESAPVTIKNCGGRVEISNDDRGYGLLINASSYFHVTGTGDPAHEYGFDVVASRTGPDYSGSGVAVGDLSTDYEIDHVEVHHSGFAGFILKTESRCDGSANLGNFVQKNTRVHHTWVHDTGGEGFYVGSTGYGGREFQCNGQPTILYPHEHDGVYLHDNLIESTGWDGLQVGVTPKNCEIHHNRIVGVGKDAPDPVQTRGIQIGGASACEVHSNYLADGPTIGIFVLGAANTRVYNNLVANFGGDGIYANDQKLTAIAGSSYVFLHNTVVGSGGRALQIFGGLTTGNAAVNNLFVASSEDALGDGGDVDWLEQGNLVLASVDEAGFIDGANGNYRISESSAARDQGVVIPNLSVTHDQDGVPRDDQPDVGAYEYTDQPIPDGGVPGNGGSGGSGGSSGAASGGSSGSAGSAGSNGAAPGSEDDGGCGCRASSSGSTSWLALAALLGAALLRRRAGGWPRP